MVVWTIAALTLREAARRRLLTAVGILTLVMIIFTVWGFSRLPTLTCGGTPCSPVEIRTIAAGLLILVAYMFSVILAIGAAFVAAPAIAGEIESGVMLAMLPRPIRRAEIVLGKWLGLAILVTLYAGFTGALEFLGIKLAIGYVPPQPVLALLFLIGQGIVLLTLALFCSTRLSPITAGVVAVILFGLARLGGIAEAIGLAFQNETIAAVGTVMSLLLPTDGLWRGVAFFMEPVALIALASNQRAAAANPFFASSPPTTAFILWAVGWVVVVLGMAVFSFDRRDL